MVPATSVVRTHKAEGDNNYALAVLGEFLAHQVECTKISEDRRQRRPRLITIHIDIGCKCVSFTCGKQRRLLVDSVLGAKIYCFPCDSAQSSKIQREVQANTLSFSPIDDSHLKMAHAEGHQIAGVSRNDTPHYHEEEWMESAES